MWNESETDWGWRLGGYLWDLVYRMATTPNLWSSICPKQKLTNCFMPALSF
jgi:hypothetical protein